MALTYEQVQSDGRRRRFAKLKFEDCWPSFDGEVANARKDKDQTILHRRNVAISRDTFAEFGNQQMSRFPQLSAGLKVINCSKRRKNLFAAFVGQDYAARIARDESERRRFLEELSNTIRNWLEDTEFTLVLYADGAEFGERFSRPLSVYSFGRTHIYHRQIVRSILAHTEVRSMGIVSLPSYLLETGSTVSGQLIDADRIARARSGYGKLCLWVAFGLALWSGFDDSRVWPLIVAIALFSMGYRISKPSKPQFNAS